MIYFLAKNLCQICKIELGVFVAEEDVMAVSFSSEEL